MLDVCEKREVQQNLVSPAMIGVGWKRLFIKLKRPKYTSEFRRCCESHKATLLMKSSASLEASSARFITGCIAISITIAWPTSTMRHGPDDHERPPKSPRRVSYGNSRAIR